MSEAVNPISPTRKHGAKIKTVFIGLPDPRELLAWGGRIGVEYAFTVGAHIASMDEDGWEIINGLPPMTILDPSTQSLSLNNVIIMARGKPVAGGSPSNGIRLWYVDKPIRDFLGWEDDEKDTIVVNPATDEKTESVEKAEVKAAEPKPTGRGDGSTG